MKRHHLLWIFLPVLLIGCGPKTKRNPVAQKSSLVEMEDLEKSDDAKLPPTPELPALAVIFHDLDTDNGELAGDIEISRASDESLITHYNIYWGKNPKDRLNDDPIASLSKDEKILSFRIDKDTERPEDANHILVCSSNFGQEMNECIGIPIMDQGAPKVKTLSAGFIDQDSDPGEISGDLILQMATDKSSEFGFYSAYWGSDIFTKTSEEIKKVPGIGNQIIFTIKENTPVPENSKYFLIFGLDQKGHQSLVFSIPVIDLGLPSESAVSMSFTDANTRGSFLGGEISINMASDEENIDQYRLYWGSDNSTKMTDAPIASLDKTGKDLVYKFPENTERPYLATHLLVRTANRGGEMRTGIYTLIIDKGVPLNKATNVSFTDSNLKGRHLTGDISVIPANDESDITHYTIYWGTSDQNRAGRIGRIEKGSSGLSLALDSARPEGATHLIVHSANDHGEMSDGIYSLIYDKGLPENMAQGLTYSDTDSRATFLGGNLSVLPASDQSDITKYELFWGSDASTKLAGANSIWEFNKDKNEPFSIPANLSIPPSATHFLLYSVNFDGSMLQGINLLIDDYGLPEHPATGFSFTDTALTAGMLSGSVTIVPPEDQSDLTHFHLYWANDSGQKLFQTPFGTVAKSGSPVYNFSGSVAIPPLATRFLIISKNDDGEMATGYHQGFEDKITPTENALNVVLDPDTGSDHLNIKGTVTINVNAGNETSGYISHYRLYLSDSQDRKPAGSPTAIATLPVTGSNIPHSISADIPLNNNIYLVAISVYNGIEKATGVGQLVGKTADPATSVAPGNSFSSPQTIALSSSTQGASIYYTTNGDDPNPANPAHAYGGSFTISSSTTVKAIAVKSGLKNSKISSFNYLFIAP